MIKPYRRFRPLQLGADLDKYSNRADRAILAYAVSSFEQIEAVAEASRKFPRLGLLAVTDKRLLYVQQRVLAKALVLSIPFEEIEAVQRGGRA